MSEENKTEIERREAEILRIFETITETIKPADKKTATDGMCTGDFMNIISEHYPGAEGLDSTQMYQLLIDHDYKYAIVGDAIVWLVKKIE